MREESSFSVSELVRKLKTAVEANFKYIRVLGEVTQISRAHSGHYYFNLSDDQALISCALFRMDAKFNPVIQTLKEGDLIEVDGSISLYPKRSSIQIIVKKIAKKDQKGLLVERFNKLRLKLFKEGLLDEQLKKSIPRNPQHIALITSPEGAAYGDFIKILDENSFSYHVTLFPAVVQGRNSESSLLQALDQVMNSKRKYDVIVFTRGGGSLEDLWSFNSEKLARKTFECPIPVISAIGHEINTSILDLVADLRCSTPSDAAKYLSVYQREQKIRFEHISKKINVLINSKLGEIQRVRKSYSPKVFLSTLENRLSLEKMKISRFQEKDYLQKFNVYQFEMELDNLIDKSFVFLKQSLKDYEYRLNQVKTLQSGLNPKLVLNRGYTYIESDAKIVEDKKSFINKKKEDFLIYFKDGKVKVRGSFKDE